MSQGNSHDRRKEQLWQRWIQQWRSSGLTVRAFCDRHHLSEPSFYAWRRVLHQRQAAAAAFVPVRVVPDERPAAAGALDLVLPGCRTVRVAPGFDAATLRQLLAVLEERQPC